MPWETDILGAIPAPASPNNIAKMDAWNKCEGNKSGASGLPINNPFNTTLDFGGGRSVNSAGVKAYPTWQVGVQATVQTLRSGRYRGIVSNLQSDGPGSQFASAVGNSGWGTSGTCIQGALGTGPDSGATPGGGIGGGGNVQFTYAQLMCVWTQAGGSAQTAAMAAAIAMAESGGRSNASNSNSNGSIDRGLWQINSSNGSLSTFDIMGNARAAVQMSNNGTNWRPWCTAYSDGACGTRGGGYLGSGAPYQKFLAPNTTPDCTAPINGTNAAAGQPQAQTISCNFIESSLFPFECSAGSIIAGSPAAIVGQVISGMIGSILNPLIQIVAGVMGIVGGAALMGGGIFLLVKETQTYQDISQGAQQGAGSMAWLLGPEAGVTEEAATQQSANSFELRRRQRQAARDQARQMSTQDLLRQESARYSSAQMSRMTVQGRRQAG